MDAETTNEAIGMDAQELRIFNVLGEQMVELVNGFPPFPVACALVETLTLCVVASNPNPDLARSALERLFVGMRDSLEDQIKRAAEKRAEAAENDNGR